MTIEEIQDIVFDILFLQRKGLRAMTIEEIQDIVFDILYSSETDKNLKISDLMADETDGVLGYQNVSENIATALHKEIEKECILARIELIKNIRGTPYVEWDDFISQLNERIAQLKQELEGVE